MRLNGSHEPARTRAAELLGASWTRLVMDYDFENIFYKSFSLSQLNEKLEETGSNTAAQIALNTRREEELAKLKMELDE